MESILFDYTKISPTTWVYFSSLLLLAIFFKFNRFWSIRNLDLVALIALAPGLLLVAFRDVPNTHWSFAPQLTEPLGPAEIVGYIWLFAAAGFLMLRLLADSMMVRRPLLEPNLTTGGLLFLGTALLIFLMAKVGRNANPPVEAPRVVASATVADDTSGAAPVVHSTAADEAPVGPWFYLPAIVDATKAAPSPGAPTNQRVSLVDPGWKMLLAIGGHLGVVLGLIFIGYRHFDNVRTGVATAALYLMIPYTAQMTEQVDHVIPGALLLWSVATYRLPFISGMFLGLATGAIFVPFFALPLWIAFYARRGSLRFIIGFLGTVGVLVGSLLFVDGGFAALGWQLRSMFGWGESLLGRGIWQNYFDAPYRLPVLAAFVALCGSFAIWPAQKNLGTLLSCTTAVLLGSQFWHPQQGGTYMAWYLPVLLLTIFRPNLEDRVALSVLGAGWLPRRRFFLRRSSQAA